MGCDIHLHIEVRVDGSWEHYAHPNIERYYQMFSRMAGVRQCDGIPALSPPRGMPDNPSFMTKFDCDHEGIDGHSHSWLNATEIKVLEDEFDAGGQWCPKNNNLWWHQQFGFLFGSSFGHLHNYPDSYPKEVEDVRFVFWFDN